MKLVRFTHKDKEYSGILNNHKVIVSDPDTSVKTYDEDEVIFLSPVNPSKIVSVGLNYRDHAVELGMEVPREPIIFIKPATSIIGPDGIIRFPKNSSRVDYEAELAVVIRDTIKDIEPEEAKNHITGYTCMNDVTARDLQKRDVQWTRAKSFDTFAPLGPCIETDLDPGNLRICSYLNGELKQDSTTADFIFTVPELVSFVSKVMTLLPGDVISTGTPSNVGEMIPGDEIVVEIEGIGRLRNYVKKAE